MNNWFINLFKNVIKINVKGKNIDRFIRKLIALKIDLLQIEYKNYKEANIKVYKKDYDRILEIKTIYEYDIIDSYGLIKIKRVLMKNQIFIMSLLGGIVLLIFLSNIIFSVDVVHTNKEIRNIVLKELNENGIEKYHFKKNYNQIQDIKQKILDKYKDKIEWLEIEEIGTKYQVRLEIRKINELKETKGTQNIIAKKDAIIKTVEATAGEIIKNTNDYVNKGDIIISGSINLNEDVKDTTRAEGKVYGEVWYTTTIEYPLHYQEIKDLNNQKDTYVIKFLNKEIELTFKRFKQKQVKEQDIIKHPLLPIKLVKQQQREIKKINNTYTEKEALKLANEQARKKIKSKLNDKEYIIDEKKLKITVKDSKIIVKTFFTVYEDITDYGQIEKKKETGE